MKKSSVIFILLFLVALFQQCKYETKKYDNGIEIVNIKNKLSIRGPGETDVLFFRGKKLCSNIYFVGTPFMLSPNNRYILFICYEKQPGHYEIYDTVENKKIIFPQMSQINLFLDNENNKTSWNEEKLILNENKDLFILYLKDKIIERHIEKQELLDKRINDKITIRDAIKNEFYEYLVILLHQFFDNIEKADQKKVISFSSVYLNQYPLKNIYGIEITPKTFAELGNCFHTILEEYKNKYGNTLIYQIIERTYKNAYEELDGKVQLKKYFTW